MQLPTEADPKNTLRFSIHGKQTKLANRIIANLKIQRLSTRVVHQTIQLEKVVHQMIHFERVVRQMIQLEIILHRMIQLHRIVHQTLQLERVVHQMIQRIRCAPDDSTQGIVHQTIPRKEVC